MRRSIEQRGMQVKPAGGDDKSWVQNDDVTSERMQVSVKDATGKPAQIVNPDIGNRRFRADTLPGALYVYKMPLRTFSDKDMGVAFRFRQLLQEPDEFRGKRNCVRRPANRLRDTPNRPIEIQILPFHLENFLPPGARKNGGHKCRPRIFVPLLFQRFEDTGEFVR